MKEGLTQYELMIIINPEIGQDAVKTKLSGLKKELEQHGEVFFEDLWGERDLAYPMSGKSKGYYAVFDFYFDPKEIKELENGLRLDVEVLRYLTVKLPLKYEPKSLADFEAEKAAKAEEAEVEKEKSPKGARVRKS